jgi:hypothetical protein
MLPSTALVSAHLQQETQRALTYLTQEKASAHLVGEVMQKKLRSVQAALQMLAQVQEDLDKQAEELDIQVECLSPIQSSN